MTDRIFHGGCLCGAVRYRALGGPEFTNVCYCTQCRRQTGSAMPAFATYAADRVTVEQGKPASFRSSSIAVREFCATCGSALFWRRDGMDKVDVFLGSFDTPEALPKPKMQIWTMHRLPWVTAIDTIEAHREAKA